MFAGIYFIGRDKNSTKIIAKTDLSINYIPEDKRDSIYDGFNGNIYKTLKVNTDVELHAYYDVTDPRNKVFDYAMYDAEGNKLCDMDATKSVAMHFILNGKKGKITNIIQNRTIDVNGNEKSFLIVTVK